jgi:hypothetical protein
VRHPRYFSADLCRSGCPGTGLRTSSRTGKNLRLPGRTRAPMYLVDQGTVHPGEMQVNVNPASAIPLQTFHPVGIPSIQLAGSVQY